MPSSSLSVSGLAVLTGLVLFPCTFANVWKMGVGYIAAVLRAFPSTSRPPEMHCNRFATDSSCWTVAIYVIFQVRFPF